MLEAKEKFEKNLESVVTETIQRELLKSFFLDEIEKKLPVGVLHLLTKNLVSSIAYLFDDEF